MRINKASDDAAGLAIAENLKTDTRLSNQAIKNVNDGISMISIISGALGAQKDILYRMAELAEQSSNGVLGNQQRQALQGEYKALLDEFDRVASTTKFNDISLLRNQDPNTIRLMAGISGADESLLELTAANSHQYAGVLAQRVNWNTDTTVGSTDRNIERSYARNLARQTTLSSLPRAQDPALINTTTISGESVRVSVQLSRTEGSYTAIGGPIATEPTERRYYATAILASTGEESSLNTTYSASTNQLDLTFNFVTAGTSSNISLDLSGLSYQLKDPVEIALSVSNADVTTRQTAIGFTNLYTQESSKRALDTVRNRIEDVSSLEGTYGAIEARLLVANNQLQTNKENFTSAASQITDADIATESSQLIKNQILQQSANAILGQANQQTSIVLNLLN